MWPGRDQEPYGEPFQHFAMLGKAEEFDVSNLVYRQEWRAFMTETLGFQLKEGRKLDEIVSLEERKAERMAFELDKKKGHEDRLAQKQAEMELKEEKK